MGLVSEFEETSRSLVSDERGAEKVEQSGLGGWYKESVVGGLGEYHFGTQ